MIICKLLLKVNPYNFIDIFNLKINTSWATRIPKLRSGFVRRHEIGTLPNKIQKGPYRLGSHEKRVGAKRNHPLHKVKGMGEFNS